MMKKGGCLDFSDAKNKKEFWLVFLTFGIMIGIARMMNENASLVAVLNGGKS